MTQKLQLTTAQQWRLILTLAEPHDPAAGLQQALKIASARTVLSFAVSHGQPQQVLALLRGSHKLRQHVIRSWPEPDVNWPPSRAEQVATVDQARAIEAEIAARRAVGEIL